MRIALAVLLVIHGLIHLIGFLPRVGVATPMRGDTLFALPAWLDRPIGVLWLLAAAALVAAGAMALFRIAGWWTLAAAGAVVSQLLIVHAWPEAKFGTLANVVVLAGSLLAWADAGFQAENRVAIQRLLASVPRSPGPVVAREELAALPEPVRRWLDGAGVVGKPRVRSLRLRQRGAMRTSPDQAFMPADAEQYFTIDVPGFVWCVRVTMMKVLPVAGRDSYVDGRGRMRIVAASLVPIVDATGPAIDQGTLLRFLGEMVWFPSAALSPYLHWERLDDTTARVTMTYRDVSATAEVTFDAFGRFTELAAQRYMGSGPDATLRPWSVRATDWGAQDGVVVPVAGVVTWKLDGRDFDYYRWEITELEYDP